jgi:hypothetical protein
MGEAFKEYYTPIELASKLNLEQIKNFLIGENFAGILKLCAKKIDLGSLKKLRKTVRIVALSNFINKKFSIDGSKKITLLYCAFINNKYHEMEFLLKNGAYINTEYDLLEDFWYLLKTIGANGPVIKKEDFKTGSLLTLAAAGNNRDMVYFLINNGATVERKDIDIATFDEIKTFLIAKRQEQEEERSKKSLCSKVKQEELPSVLGKRPLSKNIPTINFNNSGVNSVTSVSDVSEFARKRKID